MLGSISLQQPLFKGFNTDRCIGDGQFFVLENLNKVNIFVGANNSGKSRFMRYLATPNLSGFTIEESIMLLKFAEKYKSEFEVVAKSRNILEVSQLSEFYKMLQTTEQSRLHWAYQALQLAGRMAAQPHIVTFQVKVKHTNTLTEETNCNPSSSHVAWLTKLRENNPLWQSLNTDDSKRAEICKHLFKRRLYIPVIRSLRSFEPSNSDIFANRIRKEYFNEKDTISIFSGLSLFNELTEMLLGNHSQRKAVRDFEDFLKNKFFSGQDVTLVPKHKQEVVTVKIGNEQEREIHELGDGIQSIIILTFPLFKHKDESMLVLIEEPETYMHPGIQRIFLDTITKEFPKHQFFVTTHSNHFLDLTMDYQNVSIYAFSKAIDDKQTTEQTPVFNVETLSYDSFRPMELLGVRNSSVLLSNCTIWVEGITDRLYLGHYLDLYQKTLEGKPGYRFMRKDFEFSFVEYGGNNITHWSFLDDGENETINTVRLCGKLFLITDKDSKAKEPRHKKLAEKLGKQYYCLKCSEIENLISPKILRQVVEEYEGVNAVAGSDGDNNYKPLNYEDYSVQKLGTFLDGWLKKDKSRKGSYASKSGTVTDKLNFCKKVIKFTEKFDDLSDEAKKLSKRIYDFIRMNN